MQFKPWSSHHQRLHQFLCHEAPASCVTPLWTGCQSIAGGDSQQYTASTHLRTWVRRDIVEQSFLPKETKRRQGSNPDLWIQVQPVQPEEKMGEEIIGADCHVFDSNGLRSGMAHKCACSKCIGRWPKTPQLLPTS